MIRASELNDRSAGVSGFSGDGELEVTHARSAAQADQGALVFLSGAAGDGAAALAAAGFGAAVVCDAATAERLSGNPRLALLSAAHPRLAFMRLVARHFPPARPAAGVHPTACVDPSAEVDPTASIGAFCHVGRDCLIGAGSVLHPHVTLYDKVRIGRSVIIHAGTALGADGFGYERGEDGALEKFPHLGGVVVEDGVEIGSNTSIDRGSLGDTRVRRGAKIDNLVHIAHNADIGEDAVVIAQSMVGGSARIGNRAWLAPAAVVMNQVRVGDDALVGMGAVVTKAVADGQTVIGAPAAPEAEFRAVRAALKALAHGR